VRVAAASAKEFDSLDEVKIPVAETKPQTHPSAGFVPVAPERPKFNTSRELKLAGMLDQGNTNLKIVIPTGHNMPKAEAGPVNGHAGNKSTPATPEKDAMRKRKGLLGTPVRKAAAVLMLLVGFSVLLYGTQSYLSGRGISLLDWARGVKQGTAIANINLRSDPSPRKDPVGYVPKDSRVRIVNISDNWYEIDVVEYGGPKRNQDDSDHGWVNKQYVDLR
jgi:hypothetical protein